jgi:hypothetical protein
MTASSFHLSMQAAILAMAWWHWLLLVLAGFIVFTWLAMKSYRRSMRNKLVRYIREHHPDAEVVSEHSDHLMIRVGQGEPGRMNLHNLFEQASNAKTPEEEQALFKKFAGGIIESTKRAARPMSLAEDGDCLLPRLVNATDLESLSDRVKMPHQPLTGTGLSVVYVRDSEDTVSYLSEPMLAELGVDVPALHERALANLRKKSSPNFVRQAMDGHTLALFKLGDTFDAARLLLIPEQLAEGETIAAMVSDRDTLAVAPVPADGDWSSLTKLAKTTDGPRLLNRPLKVTRHGFELMGNA